MITRKFVRNDCNRMITIILVKHYKYAVRNLSLDNIGRYQSPDNPEHPLGHGHPKHTVDFG